jgi:hypothetical protein
MIDAERLIADSHEGAAKVTPTGDRVTDMILHACAGLPFSGYAGEIEPITPEMAWCHAVLSGAMLPALNYKGLTGYELCHAVFYATDFARKPIINLLAQAHILKQATQDPDLLCEYGIALYAVGGVPTQDMIAAAQSPTTEHHEVVARILKAIV